MPSTRANKTVITSTDIFKLKGYWPIGPEQLRDEIRNLSLEDLKKIVDAKTNG